MNLDVENDSTAHEKEVANFEGKLRDLEAFIGQDDSIGPETTNERQPLLANGRKKRL